MHSVVSIKILYLPIFSLFKPVKLHSKVLVSKVNYHGLFWL